MAFIAATYNVLATAHLGCGDYTRVAPGLLDPEWREPALVRHIAGLGADLLCLQEVEPVLFGALADGLEPLGYRGLAEPKGRGKPDGCATFWRASVFDLRDAWRLEYRDQERGPDGHSGHVAQLLVLEYAGRPLGVANTHIRWDRPGTPPAAQVGHRQVEELLAACVGCDGWLACGDFNRPPGGEAVEALRRAGFAAAHDGRPHVRSAVVNGRAVLLDYLFYTPSLTCRPIEPAEVSGDTVLPSASQPSDHLALMADFDWASGR